jgi:AcrR family transcriptional regulator
MDVRRHLTRPSRRSQTHARLLKAAKALFRLRGFGLVTVDDICRAAGVSKGGFYHHFPSKDAVFQEAALEELRRETSLPARAAADVARGHAGSALLVDLWAWAPRHPQARRSVRAAHREVLGRLAAFPGQERSAARSRGDREAQATLALLVGIGRVVQRARAQYPVTRERERTKAAAS